MPVLTPAAGDIDARAYVVLAVDAFKAIGARRHLAIWELRQLDGLPDSSHDHRQAGTCPAGDCLRGDGTRYCGYTNARAWACGDRAAAALIGAAAEPTATAAPDVVTPEPAPSQDTYTVQEGISLDLEYALQGMVDGLDEELKLTKGQERRDPASRY